MIDFEMQDSIEKYLDGKMSSEEKSGFEKELDLNPELREQLSITQQMNAVLEANSRIDIREKIENAERKIIKEKRIKIGASILGLVLVGATISVFLTNNKTSEKGAKPKSDVSVASENTTPGNSENEQIEENSSIQSFENKVIVEVESSKKELQKVDENGENNFLVEDDIQNQTASAYKKEVVVNSNTQSDKPLNTTSEKKDCIRPQFTIQTTKANTGSENGKISILTNSQKNIDYSLIGSKKLKSSSGIFENLTAGKYDLKAKDEEGCEFNWAEPISVGETFCLETKDFSWNKRFQQTFDINIQKAQSLRILDTQRKEIVLKTSFDSDQFEWNGNKQNGELAGLGVYKIIVTLLNNETCIYGLVVEE